MENNELFDSIELLAKEKHIDPSIIAHTAEETILTACKQKYRHTENITINIDLENRELTVLQSRTVVEDVEDDELEISLEAARDIDSHYEVGDIVNFEINTKDFGRKPASSAKNTMNQTLREEEKSVLYDEYSGLENQVVTGIVQRYIGKNISIDLGHTEATLFASEQIKGENLKTTDRIKVYIVEVKKSSRGLKITVSRTHPNLVKRLFEEEVTEVKDGIVEIKNVAREAGSRTKIAVWSNDPDVDPVGACVGMNGSRVEAIVDELGNEKIDIVEWDENPARLIENALSPAPVISVLADSENKEAKVVVPDKKLSLAIGKEGQNARLAAHLTGFKIDIKSETQAIESGEYYYDEDGYLIYDGGEYYDDEDEEYYDDDYEVEENADEATETEVLDEE